MCIVSSIANICHLKTHLNRTIFARPMVDPVASYPVCWSVGQGNCCTKSASWCASNNIIACTDVILAKDCYRRFTENVTKITYNVPLQVSIIQQYDSANVYFLVQECGGGSQTNWTQTKLGWRQTWGWLEPPTTDLPLVPDDLLKVVTVNAKQTDTRGYTYNMHRLECSVCGECKVSVWVWNWKWWDICVSQLGTTQCLTTLRHMSHQAEQGETPVWPSRKRWSRHWQHSHKGHHHYFEVSIPVWMVAMHSISTDKRYRNAPDPLGPPL